MSLDFLFGRGFVGFRNARVGDWCTIDALRIEIPDLQFPFDVRGGPSRFRNIRCALRELRFSVSESAFAAALARAAEDIDGFHDVRITFGDGHVTLSARVSLLAADGFLASRLAPVSPHPDAPTTLRFTAIEHVTWGTLPAPAPVLLQELGRRLLALPAFTPVVDTLAAHVSLDTLALPVARLVTASALLPAGWKIPGDETAQIDGVEIRPGAMTVHVSSTVGVRQRGADDGAPIRDSLRDGDGARAVAIDELKASVPAGERALATGDWASAAAAWREAADRLGPHRVVHARLLDALLALPRPDTLAEAAEIVADRLREDPDDLVALQFSARLALLRSDLDGWDQASRRLIDALRAARRTPEQVLGLLHLALGAGRHPDLADATRAVEDALRLSPRHRSALEVRASLARATGDFDALEDALRRLVPLLLQRDERLACLLEVAALALDRRGDAVEARLHLERARELAPDRPEIWSELARVLLDEGRHVEAIRALSRCAELHRATDPVSAAEAWLRASTIWEETLGDRESAAVEARKAREVAPDHTPSALRCLGLAVRMARHDEAIRVADSLLPRLEERWSRGRSDPDRDAWLRALEWTADVQDARERPDEAARLRRRILDLDPSRTAALAALDRHLRHAGRPEELVDLHMRRLDSLRDPDEIVQTRLLLAHLAENTLGASDDALRHLAEALRVAPDDERIPERIRTLAERTWALRTLVPLLRDVAPRATRRDTRARLFRLLAVAAWAAGDADTAREAIEVALAARPADPDTLTLAADWFTGEARMRAATALAALGTDPAAGARVLAVAAERCVVDGAPDAAMTLFDRALALHADDTVAARRLAWLDGAPLQPLVPAPALPPRVPAAGSGSLAVGATTSSTRADLAEAHPRRPLPPALPIFEPRPIEAAAPTFTTEAPRAVDAPTTAPAPEPSTAPDTAPTPPSNDPTPAPARDAERLHARIAVDEAQRRGDPRAIVDALHHLADLETDPPLRAAALCQAAQLLYHDLEDARVAREWLDEARRLDPDGVGRSWELLSTLEAICEDHTDADGLAEVYEARLADATDGDMRSVHRMLLASTLFERLGRPTDALAQLDALLADDPRHVPALRLAAEIRAATGHRTEAAEAFARVLALPELDALEAQDIRRQLGHLLLDDLDRPLDAVPHFEALLREIPGDTDALSALKRAFGTTGRWADCADVLLREASILAGRTPPFADVPALLDASTSALPEALRTPWAQVLLELSAVCEHAGNDALADRLVDAAGRAQPEDATIIEARVALLRRRGQPARLAEALCALAPSLLRPADREATLLEALHAWCEAGDMSAAQRVAEGLGDVGARALAERSPGRDRKKRKDRGANTAVAAETVPAEPPPFTPDAAATIDDVPRLDAEAERSGPDRGLAIVAAWLPLARTMPLRRELLVRRGRWLLDAGRPGNEALLPLKGALILDDRALDTHLELFRAFVRCGDGRQAMEQLREIAALWKAAAESARPDDRWLRAEALRFLTTDAAPSPSRLLDALTRIDPAFAARIGRVLSQ